MAYEIIFPDEKTFKLFNTTLTKFESKQLRKDFELLSPSSGVSLGGGVLKRRLARQNQGKSGGFRVYYYFQKENKIYLLHVSSKNQEVNISNAILLELKNIVQSIKDRN